MESCAFILFYFQTNSIFILPGPDFLMISIARERCSSMQMLEGEQAHSGMTPTAISHLAFCLLWGTAWSWTLENMLSLPS